MQRFYLLASTLADYELLQMDASSLYMALLAETLYEIFKLGMKEESRKRGFQVPNKYDERIPGLFKVEFRVKQ